MSKPSAEDFARAQRWAEHIAGGAWAGDWEDREAAARVLAFLLGERHSTAEAWRRGVRFAWGCDELPGEIEKHNPYALPAVRT